MTFKEAQQKLCRKLNLDYDDVSDGLCSLFSLDDIKEYILDAIVLALSYRPWNLLEGSKVITGIDTPYYDYPEHFKVGSMWLLLVAGEEFDKIDFQDYLKYKKENPTGTDKLWAEYGNLVFVNQSAYSVGDEISMFGKELINKVSGDTDLMPFSPNEDLEDGQGNIAIIQLAYAAALASDVKKESSKSNKENKEAIAQLDLLWDQEGRNRSLEKPKDRPMFEIPDFFKK